ncbi:hypothetical protein XACM_1412 [Xanthomonas euvesicatoria pv. citrumelo F1]|nr:hypothetical protein XACM_1412 [Xanthomonas euvesicatoria pv. citrumelo F1]
MVVMRALPAGSGPASALASWPVLVTAGASLLLGGSAIAIGVPLEQLARGGAVRSSQPLSRRRPMWRVEFSGPRAVAAFAAVDVAAQARAARAKRFRKVTCVMEAIVCIGDVTNSDAPDTNFINCQ